MTMHKITRRQFLVTAAAGTASLSLFGIAPAWATTDTLPLVQHAIPRTGEKLPVIGLGTAGNLDGIRDPATKKRLIVVLQAFFDHGGRLIDSSPMYGDAESAIGELLNDVKNKDSLFAATKVWTYGREAGIKQMYQSFKRMGVEKMDLMQIHNLRDWQTHIATLREWKEQGKIGFLGITTSHGRDHAELERIMEAEELDFVQFSYSMGERAAEQRLLPLAAEKGIATLINRPFQRGELFMNVKGQPLPKWATEFDCHSWGQFFLKFVVSHPAVTCVIPRTSKLEHMVDNMEAGRGRLPDEATRVKMLSLLNSI
ncbi:MAG: oxidoreductase [Nitrospirales bacterium]|nr:MAG: oxidoreductase [Nitrospirales bacterium]